MNEALKRETEKLAQSWMQYEERMLRDYLVSGVEDPRLNVQSILTRHALIEALFGGRFEALQHEELRFGAALNWLLKLFCRCVEPAECQAVQHALRHGSDNAEGLEIPEFVLRAYGTLPVQADGAAIPNYLDEALSNPEVRAERIGIPERVLAAFERIWPAVLAEETPEKLAVFEAACGSANDYRFFHSFGLDRFLDYTGLDVCSKNVQNALEQFPGTRFEVGSVFELSWPDRAFDFCLAQDLFEHLSIEGMERAVVELCRVARGELCLGFFSMFEGDEHQIRPVDDYHWNTLSLGQVKRAIEKEGFSVQAMHVGTYLESRFGCRETHNPNAYTLRARRER